MSNEPKRNRAETDTTLLRLDPFVRPGTTTTVPTLADETSTRFFVRAAAETCRQSPKPVVNPKDTTVIPPKSMLGLVSYCYSRGVYAADDIERKLRKDPAVKSVCGHEVPDAGAIRRFRRLNREAILSTLEKFFRFTRRRKVSEPLAAAVIEAPAPVASAVTPEGETTQLYARQEAGKVLDKATFVDGMSQ